MDVVNAFMFYINKAEVLREVAKTTSYTGAKMKEDDAYERIFTTRDDEEMLERYWDESKSAACNILKEFVIGYNEIDNALFALNLKFSKSFDKNLLESMRASLFSFFVMSITAKWFTMSNKEEAEGYAATAAAHLEDFMRKAYYKKKPTRPIIK